MTTTEYPPPESTETVVAETNEPHRSRVGLAVLVTIIVMALVGVGVWMLVDSDGSSGATLPDGAAETLDGYMAANLEYDGEAMLEYVTGGFHFESYGVVENAADHAATVTTEWERIDFDVVQDGDRAVAGSGQGYVVAEPQVASWNGQSGVVGMSVFNIVQFDDSSVWLIDHHEWIPKGLR